MMNFGGPGYPRGPLPWFLLVRFILGVVIFIGLCIYLK